MNGTIFQGATPTQVRYFGAGAAVTGAAVMGAAVVGVAVVGVVLDCVVVVGAVVVGVVQWVMSKFIYWWYCIMFDFVMSCAVCVLWGHMENSRMI